MRVPASFFAEENVVDVDAAVHSLFSLVVQPEVGNIELVGVETIVSYPFPVAVDVEPSH